jgi:hypothetical protein
MLLTLALRTDPDRVYARAAKVFTPEEIAEACASAVGLTIPTELQAKMKADGRPLLVIARTRPWQGIPSLRARVPKFHYVRFRPGEAEQALADLGLTREEVLR